MLLRSKVSQISDKEFEFIGNSSAAQVIKSSIDKVAPTKSRVFLFGPIGSGKKHIAKLIHNYSKRSTASIIYLNTKRLTPDSIEEELFGKENTDGIPERIGLVEQAHNGTLYIDEASNLCKKSQRRLIKLLTENRFTE